MTATSPGRQLAAFGFGPTSGRWGGMVTDSIDIPYTDHMLVKLPAGLDPLRGAAASDNLADAWRAVVPPLRQRPGGRVLVMGGGGQSIGLYAAGLAVAHGAAVVDHIDDLSALPTTYDVVVEASSHPQGLRDALHALRPGGICTGTGYYLNAHTKLPVMDMYATSATLKVGVSNVRPLLPELLDLA